MKGNRITSPGLSLNQIIKSFGSVEELANGLKELLKYVALHDREVISEINHSITRISFGGALYSKFDKTIRKLDFVEKVS